jgi:hypothetical protein
MSDIPKRLMRKALGGRMAPVAAGCIDSETLAAWFDGTLSRRERAAAELHASSCVRCQSLVAAMARTLPPLPATKRWWPFDWAQGKPSTTLAWLTPVAAVAVAVLSWIYVKPLFEPARVPASAASSPTVSVDRLADSRAAQRQDIPPAPPAALAPKPASKADEPRAGIATRATPEVDSPERENRAATEMRDAAAAPPQAAPAPSRSEAPRLQAAAEAAATTTAAAPEAPPANVPESARVTSDQTAFGLQARAMAKVSFGATDILAPDANVRWRILTGGDVARSIDGGRTWQTQSTGVPSTLTAGSAPSPTICWLVGPGGIIVMSTDGQSWHRVSFPEAIDLTSVRASDGANAAVTAANGRTFTTIDGGTTWRRP